MACRRCGCLSSSDLGQPGGAASLDDNGQVVQRGYIPTDQTRRTAGDVVVSSAVWVDLAEIDALVLPAAAGDTVEVSLSGFWVAGTATYGALDVATPVNGLGEAGPLDNTHYGVPSWLGYPNVESHIAGSIQYVLQPLDVFAGETTLHVVARVIGGASKTFNAVDVLPFLFSAKNLGQA